MHNTLPCVSVRKVNLPSEAPRRTTINVPVSRRNGRSVRTGHSNDLPKANATCASFLRAKYRRLFSFASPAVRPPDERFLNKCNYQKLSPTRLNPHLSPVKKKKARGGMAGQTRTARKSPQAPRRYTRGIEHGRTFASSVLQSLDNGRNALSDSDAHRCESIARISPTQLVDKRHKDARP